MHSKNNNNNNNNNNNTFEWHVSTHTSRRFRPRRSRQAICSGDTVLAVSAAWLLASDCSGAGAPCPPVPCGVVGAAAASAVSA